MVPPSPPPLLQSSPSSLVDYEDEQADPSTNLGRLVAVMLVTAGALVLGGLGIAHVVQGVAGDRVTEAAERTISSGDTRAMEAMAQRLEGGCLAHRVLSPFCGRDPAPRGRGQPGPGVQAALGGRAHRRW